MFFQTSSVVTNLYEEKNSAEISGKICELSVKPF